MQLNKLAVIVQPTLINSDNLPTEDQIKFKYQIDRLCSYPSIPVRPASAVAIDGNATSLDQIKLPPQPPRARFLLKCENLAVLPNTGIYVDLTERQLISLPSLDYRLLIEELSHTKRQQLRLPSSIRYIEGSSLNLDCLWANSFFHFMTDVLGKLFVTELTVSLKTFDSIIYPFDLSHFSEWWFKRLGIYGRIIKTQEPLLLERGFLPSYSQHVGWYSPDFLNWVRATVPQELMNYGARTSRLYIAGRTNRRLVNELNLIRELSVFGFTTIYPAEMSIEDQIRAFSNADLIVAPHGAALANLIFASEGISVIELFGRGYINPCYLELTTMVGGRYHYLLGVDVGKGDYKIDISKLLDYIKKTG